MAVAGATSGPEPSGSGRVSRTVRPSVSQAVVVVAPA